MYTYIAWAALIYYFPMALIFIIFFALLSYVCLECKFYLNDKGNLTHPIGYKNINDKK